MTSLLPFSPLSPIPKGGNRKPALHCIPSIQHHCWHLAGVQHTFMNSQMNKQRELFILPECLCLFTFLHLHSQSILYYGETEFQLGATKTSLLKLPLWQGVHTGAPWRPGIQAVAGGQEASAHRAPAMPLPSDQL